MRNSWTKITKLDVLPPTKLVEQVFWSTLEVWPSKMEVVYIDTHQPCWDRGEWVVNSWGLLKPCWFGVVHRLGKARARVSRWWAIHRRVRWNMTTGWWFGTWPLLTIIILLSIINHGNPIKYDNIGCLNRQLLMCVFCDQHWPTKCATEWLKWLSFNTFFLGNHGSLEVTPYGIYGNIFQTGNIGHDSGELANVRNRVRSIRFYGDMGPQWDPIGTSKSLVSTTKFLPSMAPRRHLRGNDGDAEFLQDRASWIWWNRHRSTGWEVTARNPAWINFDGPTNMKIACKSQHFGYLTQALFFSAGAHDILRFLADLIFTCCRVYKSTVSVEQIEKSQKNPMFRWHSITFSFLVHPSCSGQPRSTSPGCAMTDVIRKVPAPMA